MFKTLKYTNIFNDFMKTQLTFKYHSSYSQHVISWRHQLQLYSVFFLLNCPIKAARIANSYKTREKIFSWKCNGLFDNTWGKSFFKQTSLLIKLSESKRQNRYEKEFS